MNKLVSRNQLHNGLMVPTVGVRVNAFSVVKGKASKFPPQDTISDMYEL